MSDFIVTNDPRDGSQKPEPEAVRKWWESLLAESKKGRVIFIRSRLHERDLVGHVLDPDGK